MPFNFKLLLALYFLVISMTIILFVAWHFNRDIRGLREWFIAYLSAFININFYIFNTVHSELVFMYANQITLMGTGYFALKGCCEHMGIKCSIEYIAVPMIIIVLGISYYFTSIENNLAIRFFISSLVSGLFFIVGALYLLRGSFKESPFRHLLGLTLFAHGLFNVLRSVLFSKKLEAILNTSLITPTDLIIYEQIMITSLLPLGIVLLTNEIISLELRKHAEHDSLTNLYNRRIFLDFLNKAKSLAIRSRTPLSLLVVDIDYFKAINDNFGHLAGDEVLIDFAKNIQKNLRKEDVVGRMGGEEFAIVLPNISVAAAISFAERLRSITQTTPVFTNKGQINYTISIGITNIESTTTIEQALDVADAAMYEAKKNGRNSVVYKSIDTSKEQFKVRLTDSQLKTINI
jgi:diguanylate cyclase (GGDEF)-like protein